MRHGRRLTRTVRPTPFMFAGRGFPREWLCQRTLNHCRRDSTPPGTASFWCTRLRNLGRFRIAGNFHVFSDAEKIQQIRKMLLLVQRNRSQHRRMVRRLNALITQKIDNDSKSFWVKIQEIIAGLVALDVLIPTTREQMGKISVFEDAERRSLDAKNFPSNIDCHYIVHLPIVASHRLRNPLELAFATFKRQMLCFILIPELLAFGLQLAKPSGTLLPQVFLGLSNEAQQLLRALLNLVLNCACDDGGFQRS
mmetsp:Transcript_41553/g.90547  ORF Transcript_41553/g.90547 Transcript_41553/m.90547 type:complete len:252 (+) Transcript_41553:652-1407(+)